MKENAIVISNLSKKYYIIESEKQEKRNKINVFNKSSREFYALSNINLEIKRGELITIIGSNGSGKSTLLKLISEITPPSKGTIEVNGTIASILEIGIGFQPDLSGLENIYLSGYMYGLRKSEITKNIDSIIELFGFSNFINTPVKYYSSGMYMRLAFSIIIHIKADIYLFDEILSVGDASFQSIAINKIKKLNSSGATICLISHTPNLIAEISDKMLLLNKSEQILFSKSSLAIEKYHNLLFNSNPENKNDKLTLNSQELNSIKNLLETSEEFQFNIEEIKIYNKNATQNNIYTDFEIIIECTLSYVSNLPLQLGLLIKDQNQIIITSCDTELKPSKFYSKTNVIYTIPPFSLNPTLYIFDYLILRNSEVAVIYPLANPLTISSKIKSKTLGPANLNISSEIQNK
ncbi:MAG: ABC transporter ATP-binding protein [Bacteroidales bacterium]|nr:ABC transporter ATP-binding protein [Bacteroidales bacterium]